MRHINHKFIKFILLLLYFQRNTIKNFHSCFPSVWVIHQFCQCVRVYGYFFFVSWTKGVALIWFFMVVALCRWYSFLINYMGNRIRVDVEMDVVWNKWLSTCNLNLLLQTMCVLRLIYLSHEKWCWVCEVNRKEKEMCTFNNRSIIERRDPLFMFYYGFIEIV